MKKNERVLLFAGAGAAVALVGYAAYAWISSQGLPVSPDTSGTASSTPQRSISDYSSTFASYSDTNFISAFLNRINKYANPAPDFGVDASKYNLNNTTAAPDFSVGDGDTTGSITSGSDSWTSAGSSGDNSFGVHF